MDTIHSGEAVNLAGLLYGKQWICSRKCQMEKKCTRCGEIKSTDEFYKVKNRPNGTGICSHCKKCQNIMTAEWERKNRKQNYDRHQRYRIAHMKLYSNSVKQWRIRNKNKLMAHRIVRNAIRRKDLIRGSCSICGLPNAHAHHESYEEPLKITWLCRKHHLMRHRKIIT
jgi:hypothetical protein